MSKECIAKAKSILVTHKRRIWGVIALVVVLVALTAGAHAMFRVNGVVTSVDNNSITVASFFRTQTVDLTGAPVNVSKIKPGDRVKIQKGMQGNILYVRIFPARNGEYKHERRRYEH